VLRAHARKCGHDPVGEKQAGQGRTERSYPEDTGAPADAARHRFAAARARAYFWPGAPSCRIVLTAIAVALLSACGSGPEASAPEAEPPATTQATEQEAGLTPATAGLTIDDPGPGEVLEAFVDAAAAGDLEAIWTLLSPASQERLGPTTEDFAERFGTGFQEGLGTFGGTPYEVVLSRRDELGWGVAGIAGIRTREGEEEFAAYGAAFRRDGDRWLLELGAPIELARLPDPPAGTLQVEMSADEALEAAGLWLDGEPLPAHLEGRRRDFVVEAQLPAGAAATAVVVAFARTAAGATGGAFPLFDTAGGDDTGPPDVTA
jgi:hypothetical protein